MSEKASDYQVGEDWVQISDFDGYEASSMGRVRSWRPERRFAKPPEQPRILKVKVDKDGYRCVTLFKQGKRKDLRISSIVCSCFHGERPSAKYVVRHLDGTKDNDVPQNLAWGTHQQNSADMIEHGTRVQGIHVNTTKLTEDDVREIRASKLSCTDLAKIYPVNISMISKIKLNQNWRHVA